MPEASAEGRCRICGLSTRVVLDLGAMPPANWFTQQRDGALEAFPLVLELCTCGNVQLRECVDAELLYGNYNYVTPDAASLEEHYAALVEHLRASGALGKSTRVLEIGSNIGRFLRALRPYARSIVGVDPARNIVHAALAQGIPTEPAFFGAEFARRYKRSHGEVDLIVARHCMAHNADPYGMLDGVGELLAPGGTLLIENAYAIDTFENNEFDQIYHEHMLYFTARSVATMLERCGLHLRELLHVPVHGGSIVCIATRNGDALSPSVAQALERERALFDNGLLERFAAATETIRRELPVLIRRLASEGKRVYTYGASAKGSMLLNACGLTDREIAYCADSTPEKVGRFMPKSNVEIVSEEWAFEHPPDAFLLTAWNYRDELIEKARNAGLADVRFIVPIPSITLL